MAKPVIGAHYLRVGAPKSEPRQYLSLEAVTSALADLVQLQQDRGFVTTADPDGKRTSRHPDGRVTQFWAENDRGDIVS